MPSALFLELLHRLAEEHEREVRAARAGIEHQHVPEEGVAGSGGGAATAEGAAAPSTAGAGLSGGPVDLAREVPLRLDVLTLAVAGAKPPPPASAWRGRMPSQIPDGFAGPTNAGLDGAGEQQQASCIVGGSVPRGSATFRRRGEELHSRQRRLSPPAVAGGRASLGMMKDVDESQLSPRRSGGTASLGATRLQPCLARVVDDPKFDMCIAVVVCLNALTLGWQIDHEAISDSPGQAFKVLEYVFSCLFSLELALRVSVRRSEICSKSERGWMAFDSLLVTISWFDIIVTEMSGNSIQNASLMSILKIARMARIMRIIRMVRFLTQVRTMAVMIWGSMLCLFWLFVLLAAVTYAFAIILTTGATEWLKSDASVDRELYEEVRVSFGSIMRTMYTLYLAMCGGVSWGEPATKASVLGWGYFAVFLYYIFFTFFSILNIVTGVFVDSAIQLAESDRSMMIQKTLKAKEGLHHSLKELMTEMDTDDSGFISREEWRVAMKDQQTRTVMEVLDISPTETEELFTMLDVSGDGFIEIKEFVEEMAILKGHARSVDMHRVIAQNKRILELLEPKVASWQQSQ